MWLILLLVALVACLALVVVEELTQQPKVSAEAADAAVVGRRYTNLPIIAAWVVAVAGIVARALLCGRRAGGASSIASLNLTC